MNIQPPMKQPNGVSGRTVGLAFLIALSVVAVAAVFLMSPVSGFSDAKESNCSDAAEWHYREALKATPDAEYHFWAGAAAEKLASTGMECDWEAP